MLVARGVALHTGHVRRAIGCAPTALAVLQHSAQALHGLVMGLVQGVVPMGQQLDRLPDAAGLVDAALLRDGEMHRQMQECVATSVLRHAHGGQGSIQVGEVAGVFGVLIHPLNRYDFNSFQRKASAPFRITIAKKSPNIGLRWIEHGPRLTRPQWPLGPLWMCIAVYRRVTPET